MSKFSNQLIIPLLALLVACVIPPDENTEEMVRLPTDAEVEQYNASVAPEERIVCRREIPVGTNIPRRLCRMVRDVEETSTFHRDQLRRVLR
ncbi:MAG: hypothetical protein O2971_10905 [Proteobacteria bacterium]|nr:hypothetical protein [Pseudomonadota bacterium]